MAAEPIRRGNASMRVLLAIVVVLLAMPGMAATNICVSADKTTLIVGEVTTVHITAQGTVAGLWMLAGDMQVSSTGMLQSMPGSLYWQPYFNTPVVPPSPVMGVPSEGGWSNFGSLQTQWPASATFAKTAPVEIASYRIMGMKGGTVQLQFRPHTVQFYDTKETNKSSAMGVNAPLSLTVDGSVSATPPIAQAASIEVVSNTPSIVTLLASDDGHPNPPGALSYTITSLPVCGSLRDPSAGVVTAVPYTLASGGNQVIYTSTAIYGGTDSFAFKANDGGFAPAGGDSTVATISIGVAAVAYRTDMNMDPGWLLDAGWAWGAPAGGGSHGHDPTGGYTGAKVIGCNLGGNYESGLSTTRYATTPAIDCSGLRNVELMFYRWLGVDSWPHGCATIDVSKDGRTWTRVWANSAPISDATWYLATYDIHSVADGQAAVSVRFGLGPTDSGDTWPGWNIDDVIVVGDPLPNAAPTVSVVAPQTVTLPDSAVLVGTVGDDGLPNPPAILTHTWSTISGPGAITFGDVNALSTTATFRTYGTYVVQLSAFDGVLSTAATVTIAVNPKPDAGPMVDAGASQDVFEGQAVRLHAVASDPDSNPLVYTWDQIAGQAIPLGGDSTPEVTFTAPTLRTAAEAALEFTVVVNDGQGKTASDSVNVRVHMLGDTNQDNSVDVVDLLTLIAAFGSTSKDANFVATCDFNGDEGVDVVDLLIMIENWGRTLASPSFARAGLAYLAGAPAPANTARTSTLAVCPASDGINMGLRTPQPNAAWLPECTRYGRLILGGPGGHVYASNDGITVSQLSSTPPQLDGIWALASGTLIGWCPGIGPKRSTDGGVTWNLCTLNGTWTPNAYPLRKGFIEIDGVQFLAEYHAIHIPLAGRQVWKSVDDGASWTPCLDGAVVQPDPSRQWFHIHGLGYQVATGRLLAGCGDGDDRHQVWTSPDLGVTWSRLEVNLNDIPAQPMSYVDYGDPRRVVFVDDTNRGVGWLDVTTGYLGNLLPWTDGRSGGMFMFGLHRIGDVYYACGNDDSSHKRPAILVSKDLAHWAVYHVIPQSLGFLNYAGMVGGRLHFAYYDSAGTPRWLAISPASVQTRTAVLLEPGTTNLLREEAGFFDSSAGGWTVTGSGGSMERNATDNLAGSAASGCLKATYTGPSPLNLSLNLTSPPVSVSPGLTYGGLVWAKCDADSAAVSIALLNSTGAQGDNNNYYVDTTWRPLFAQPLAASGGTMSMRVVFTPTDRCRAIQIDAGQIALLPITQVQYSPAVRSPDVWSYTIDAGPAWQNEIVLTPSLLPYQLAANTKYYIRSWVKDAANNLQLYYDTADSRFHLLPTIGGVAQSPLTSDLLEWNPQACVRIQVRAGASGLAMVIADGDVPATISGSGDVRAVTGSVLTIRAGDATGANMLPHYLVTDLDHWE